MERASKIHRVTKETDILVDLSLDGKGAASLNTGLPFLEHMLEQVAKHGCLNLSIEAKGDLEVDAHHTVEDIGIALGQTFAQALDNKHCIKRYGYAYVPLDEALSRAVIDFSGRPSLTYQVHYPRARIGSFDTDLIHEFFQGYVNHAKAAVHLDNIRGSNSHHIAETVFKAFGRALRAAVEIDDRMTGIPSTKGVL